MEHGINNAPLSKATFVITFGDSITRVFFTSDMYAQVCFVSHTKLTPGWALIQVNFDPTQETGPKVGAGHSFANYGTY